MESWANKYRPKTFEDLVGQPEKAHLRLLLKQGGGFPPLLIFKGPSGSGKTTAARIVAASLNCENMGPKGDPCSVCESCLAVQSNDHPSVYEHNAAYKNGAADMREIQEIAYLQGEGAYTVFILDEAQALSAQAWKVLLKLFEEPPQGCVFILVSSEPAKIPRVIQTRALSYEFMRVGANDLVTLLQKVVEAEGSGVQNVGPIVDLAHGSVREAIMLLEQSTRAGIEPAELFSTRRLTLPLIENLVSGDMQASLVALERCWKASGNPAEVAESIAVEFQAIMYRMYGLPVSFTPDTQLRYDALSKSLGEKALSGCLEVLAHKTQTIKTKAQLIFLWQELKSLIAPAKPLPAPKRTTDNLQEALKKVEI
jgi:DNA polymerase III subunit gamma/tau